MNLACHTCVLKILYFKRKQQEYQTILINGTKICYITSTHGRGVNDVAYDALSQLGIGLSLMMNQQIHEDQLLCRDVCISADENRSTKNRLAKVALRLSQFKHCTALSAKCRRLIAGGNFIETHHNSRREE